MLSSMIFVFLALLSSCGAVRSGSVRTPLRQTPLRGVEVLGADAVPFLNAVLSNTVVAGQFSTEACLLTARGRVRELVTVVPVGHGEGALLLCVDAPGVATDLARRVVTERCEVRECPAVVVDVLLGDDDDYDDAVFAEIAAALVALQPGGCVTVSAGARRPARLFSLFSSLARARLRGRFVFVVFFLPSFFPRGRKDDSFSRASRRSTAQLLV